VILKNKYTFLPHRLVFEQSMLVKGSISAYFEDRFFIFNEDNDATCKHERIFLFLAV
jgi:hypothetical protein